MSVLWSITLWPGKLKIKRCMKEPITIAKNLTISSLRSIKASICKTKLNVRLKGTWDDF